MVARMVLAVCPFGSRSWNDLKTEKIAPWFEARVNVAPSKPAKAAVEKTPGIDVRISYAVFCLKKKKKGKLASKYALPGEEQYECAVRAGCYIVNQTHARRHGRYL